jgi:UDP-N-acetylmuramoylalanine--D-glutamate ligase
LTYRAIQVPVVAVTGTNGKSTTTVLLQALLESAGLRAAAAGNLGEPSLSLVGKPLDIAVLEVSSFQLEAVDLFRPAVAVVLNITPDHLDRHGSLHAYTEAKARILEAQTATDAAVLNADDPLVRPFAERTAGRVFFFSRQQPQEQGAWIEGGDVLLNDGRQVRRVGLRDLPLAGHHNRDNAAMALCAVLALGADIDQAAAALPRFRGLPHRAEVVAEMNGVRFIDDSKATNPGAAARALEGHDGRVVWIAGGRDKGLDFAPLGPPASRYVRTALLIGEAAGALDASLPADVARERCATLEDAVTRAGDLAESGDVVLLAPACASFDQFRDFAERGLAFQRAAAAVSKVRGAR